MTACNRFWCASCGLSFSNRLSHTCLPSAGPSVHALSVPTPVSSSAEPCEFPSASPSSDEKVASSHMPASRLDGDSRDLHSFCQTHSSAVQGCGRESFHHHHEELLCRGYQRARDVCSSCSPSAFYASNLRYVEASKRSCVAMSPCELVFWKGSNVGMLETLTCSG